ncbi:voltage-gated monoatomic cation channel TMEM109 [Lepisosteus oculatus]|uniref:voltage-gated monoatomic cation channel TMEM109 n=1 Tax=Lepisosteus oculatus TaxID=7918 RepID=UPI00371D5900
MALYPLRRPFAVLLAVLCAALPACLGQPGPAGESRGAGGTWNQLQGVVAEGCGRARRAAESVVGPETLDSALEVAQSAVRVLSEGAATGLNVVAGLCIELLKTAEVNVRLTTPLFTAEEVAKMMQWGLATLIGYWLISLALRLVGSVLRRVLWLVKFSLFMWAFFSILYHVEDPYKRAVLLVALLVVSVLLGGLRGATADDKHRSLEAKMAILEKQILDLKRNSGKKNAIRD